jgi:hypothetical protein
MKAAAFLAIGSKVGRRASEGASEREVEAGKRYPGQVEHGCVIYHVEEEDCSCDILFLVDVGVKWSKAEYVWYVLVEGLQLPNQAHKRGRRI